MIQLIREELFRLQDREYRDFQKKLIPTADPDTVIGVRTPELRKYAAQLVKSDRIDEFLSVLPHRYFDENQLHAFIVSEIRDFDRCVREITRFLPYVDNWATCDQMSPKVFRKHRNELLPHIRDRDAHAAFPGCGFQAGIPGMGCRDPVGGILREHDDRLVFCDSPGQTV